MAIEVTKKKGNMYYNHRTLCTLCAKNIIKHQIRSIFGKKSDKCQACQKNRIKNQPKNVHCGIFVAYIPLVMNISYFTNDEEKVAIRPMAYLFIKDLLDKPQTPGAAARR